jgi:hypothetical protein
MKKSLKFVFLIFYTFFICSALSAQNKKEQILKLNTKIDSLYFVLSNVREKNTELKSVNDKFVSELNYKGKELMSLKKEINSLLSEISGIEKMYISLTDSLKTQKQKLNEISKAPVLLLYDRMDVYRGGTQNMQQGGDECYQSLILYIENDTVSGNGNFYCVTRGGYSIFIIGTLIEGKIKGVLFKHKGNWADPSSMYYEQNDFTMDISDDRSYLIYPDNTKLYLSKNDISFKYAGKQKIYKLPDTKSEVINEFDLSTKNVNLIRFGKLETIKNTKDFWYYVEIDGYKGWIFGNMSFNYQ